MTADLVAASQALLLAEEVLERAVRALAAGGDEERSQLLAYDLAHSAAGVRMARVLLQQRSTSESEVAITCVFAADVLAEVAARVAGREALWGVAGDWLAPASEFVTCYRHPDAISALVGARVDAKLGPDLELVRDSFHRFALEQIRPRAEEIHRRNGDIPDDLIAGIAAMGGFGLSVPAELGGSSTASANDALAMVVATEELSWGSLAAGGSLITRPEILTRALLAGGSEQQKQQWLPCLASGESVVAVAVTEPDHGSDVGGITTTASRVDGGWRVSGVKTWCTFAARADVVMLLARTSRDRAAGHRGLSILLVEKPRCSGSGFVLDQEAAGVDPPCRLEGRPIDTIGYRGMHSYELAFDGWFVPDSHLLGGEDGLGRGFYLQMQGFESGRLQTAARAVGVMQAAYEAALSYASHRQVFGQSLLELELTRCRLGRMVALLEACRQATYSVALAPGEQRGSLDASMLKAYVCRAAEWVTREAMQVHGGMGYAEEFPVSRYFVDARVLSIFEGADETLALKVIARRLLAEAR